MNTGTQIFLAVIPWFFLLVMAGLVLTAGVAGLLALGRWLEGHRPTPRTCSRCGAERAD